MARSADVLHGRVLWITRPLEQAGDWIHACERAGARPISVPCVAIEALTDGALRAQCQLLLSQADWLLLTSPTVVRVLATCLAGEPPRRSLRVAAVGPGTAARARELGFSVELVAERADSEGLAHILRREVPLRGRLVFLPQGDRAADALTLRLQQAGAAVSPLTIYTNRAPVGLRDTVDRALTDAPPDWVLFASGSAFDHWREAWPLHAGRQRPHLASIGPHTSAVIRQAGHDVAAEAKQPTIQSLLAALASAATPSEGDG
ncbi:MAG: uroporphyrinogen-III synthase [Candidatus Sericytochromatia bacterium]|nr:uroporphyrinogen-III synthase [Candidatus Sericytochromatia bacterium]